MRHALNHAVPTFCNSFALSSQWLANSAVGIALVVGLVAELLSVSSAINPTAATGVFARKGCGAQIDVALSSWTYWSRCRGFGINQHLRESQCSQRVGIL